MKKFIMVLLTLLTLFNFSVLNGCSLLAENFNGCGPNNSSQMFDECTEISGKWIYYDYFTSEPTETYLIFNGSKNVMTFEYFQDGVLVRDGKFRVVYRGEKQDVLTPLSIGVEIKGDNKHKEWLSCFVKDFKTDFTQFTIMSEERELDFHADAGVPQVKVYKFNELPFKFGSYVKEGSTLKEQADYRNVDYHFLPSGKYQNENGAKLTFIMTYPLFDSRMFRYEYNGKTVDGVYTANTEKLHAWIDYQPGFKPTSEQKELYEIVHDFPPNYNLYGNFNVTNDTPYFTIDYFVATEGCGYNANACDWQTGKYTLISK